jgi:hypothetical protein
LKVVTAAVAVANRGIVMKMLVAVLGLAAALGACAGGQGKIVRTEEARNGYVSWTYKMSSTRGSDLSHQVYLKPSNEGGKLVVCGYIAANFTSIDQQLVEAWWRQADLSLNDAPIGKGSFLGVRKPSDRRATCLETTQAWTDQFKTGQLRLDVKGQPASVSY